MELGNHRLEEEIRLYRTNPLVEHERSITGAEVENPFVLFRARIFCKILFYF